MAQLGSRLVQELRYLELADLGRQHVVHTCPNAGGTAVALPQHTERDLLAVDRQVQE